MEVTSGSTKIKLVYGADPRVGNKTLTGETVHVFDGGVMAYTGVMITVSLDVGLELTWDSGLSLCLSVYIHVSVCFSLSVYLYVCLCLCLHQHFMYMCLCMSMNMCIL